jgi:hypothetical protein
MLRKNYNLPVLNRAESLVSFHGSTLDLADDFNVTGALIGEIRRRDLLLEQQ